MKFSSPVYNIISVPIERIEPNTYNPNSVAPPELKLLYDSIKEVRGKDMTANGSVLSMTTEMSWWRKTERKY